MVTPPIFCAGYSATRSATASAHLPPKYPSCRGITQDFAKSFSGQHGQPKYLSKRTVNIGNQWHEFNKCLECEIAPVEDQNVQPTDREAHQCPLLADFVAEVGDDRCVAPGANVFQ